MITTPPAKHKDATFSPAVLIVDDDQSVRSYYRQKFHDETSVGVVTAGSLGEAKRLLESGSIKIDAVIADLFFDRGTTAPDESLLDGIDILSYTQKIKPEIPKYVLSYWNDRPERREKAARRKLNISKWFDKIFISGSGDATSPWATVERELMARLISEVPLIEEGSDMNPSDITEPVRRVFHVPVRTYIQALGEPLQQLLLPIEVICFRDEDGIVSANAYRLGLFIEGTGESIQEALSDLAIKIADQYEMLRGFPSSQVEGYARLVRARLAKHFGEDVISDETPRD
jgi:hypothetical protein